MTIDRRQALAGAGAALAATAAGSAWSQTGAQSGRIRKGASTLSPNADDLVAFRDGVAAMKRRSDNRSWARQTRLHREKAQHGSGLFLPWHRLELAHLERIIARLTGHSTFALPYWDWQEDRFLPTWVTTPGSPLYERQRGANANTMDFAKARWATSRNVARLASDSFEVFAGLPRAAGAVEAYGHNHIHVLVGGLMGRTETAAADAVFWLHHCNIDRVWATWHSLAKPVYPSDWGKVPLTGYIGANGEDTGTWTPGAIVETSALGYRYDRLYPFPMFNVASNGPEGATRQEPIGQTAVTLSARCEPGQTKMSVTIPADIAARLRAADDSLMIAGVGQATYKRDERLLDRCLNIDILAGERKLALGSSPTFVHVGDMGGMDHSMSAMGPGMVHDHTTGDAYGVSFQFGTEILNLLARDAGPVTITVDAEDLTPDVKRANTEGLALEVVLTLTETRWV